MTKVALAIHGGAGTIIRSLMTVDLEREYRSGLSDALKVGWEILNKGGSSLDAVEATVAALEDFPLFNAGRGSVFTHEGKNEMDAAIMDGKTLDAGAVAFVRNVKNPVKLARLVMERSPHIFFAGAGATEFARQMNVEFADDAYFFTELRYQQLLEAREEGVIQLDHTAVEPLAAAESLPLSDRGGEFNVDRASTSSDSDGDAQSPSGATKKKSLGTVGAVACDANGYLAAATSTGGMTNKKFGRIGDTPIVGSGTYADDICAVSCTGHGEYFMLGVAAYDVAARMKYKNIGLIEAATETIDHLTKIGGEGGLIAVDANGNLTLPFNSEGMYRGYIKWGTGPVVDIYR